MTPAQRRALDRVHDKEAHNVTTRTLLVAFSSRGGYPEDSLARAQAEQELLERGALCTMLLWNGQRCHEPAVVCVDDATAFCAECAEWGL